MSKELEEAAESRYGTDMDSIRGSNVYDLNTDLKRGFIEGAKWQQEKYEALLKEFEQYKKESIKWSLQDFTEYEHPRYTINEYQAQDALERMIDEHDANFGISWSVIHYYIEEYGTVREDNDDN
jgi:hypothetical protein